VLCEIREEKEGFEPSMHVTSVVEEGRAVASVKFRGHSLELSLAEELLPRR
jgi:hypothetical protein